MDNVLSYFKKYRVPIEKKTLEDLGLETLQDLKLLKISDLKREDKYRKRSIMWTIEENIPDQDGNEYPD